MSGPARVGLLLGDPCGIGPELVAKVERVVAEQNAAAARDSQRLQSLERELRVLGARPAPLLLPLPELRGNIHGVEALGQIARALSSNASA